MGPSSRQHTVVGAVRKYQQRRLRSEERARERRKIKREQYPRSQGCVSRMNNDICQMLLLG